MAGALASLRSDGDPGRWSWGPPRAGHWGGRGLLAPLCRQALQPLCVEAVEVEPAGEVGRVPADASVATLASPLPPHGEGHGRHSSRQHTRTWTHTRAPGSTCPSNTENKA